MSMLDEELQRLQDDVRKLIQRRREARLPPETVPISAFSTTNLSQAVTKLSSATIAGQGANLGKPPIAQMLEGPGRVERKVVITQGPIIQKRTGNKIITIIRHIFKRD